MNVSLTNLPCLQSLCIWKFFNLNDSKMLRFMGSQRVGHNWATELNWTELKVPLNMMLLCGSYFVFHFTNVSKTAILDKYYSCFAACNDRHKMDILTVKQVIIYNLLIITFIVSSYRLFPYYFHTVPWIYK